MSITSKTSDHIHKFLLAAERAGLLAELEQKALSQHDETRRSLAAGLADVLASRPGRLAEAVAVRENLRAKFDAAAQALRDVTIELALAERNVSDAEVGLDVKENTLRGQLREIAPNCFEETWRKLHWLENRVKGAMHARSLTFYAADGRQGTKETSNFNVVAPVQSWLASTKAKVEAMTYDAMPAADAAKRCAHVLQEARTKAATVLDSAAIAEALGE
jgi:PPE-repeat protein